MWVDVDDAGVSFNTPYGRAKPTHIANDARVSLTVVDPGDPYRWLSVSGTATLVDEGADGHIDRLAKKYIGADSYPFRQPGERRASPSASRSRRSTPVLEDTGSHPPCGSEPQGACAGYPTLTEVNGRQLRRCREPRLAGVSRAEDVTRRRAEVGAPLLPSPRRRTLAAG